MADEAKPGSPATSSPATSSPATSSPGASSPAASSPAAAQTAATIRLVDRPELAEAFADSINSLLFDGQTLRIEFGVTRLDDVKPNTPLTGRRYPACRIVLPPAAAVDLINRMQQIAHALAQAGVVKATPPGAPAKAN